MNMNTKMELVWLGIVGIGVSIGLHFVRPYFEYVTPTLVKVMLYSGLGLMAYSGLLKVFEEGKGFWKRMRN